MDKLPVTSFESDLVRDGSAARLIGEAMVAPANPYELKFADFIRMLLGIRKIPI